MWIALLQLQKLNNYRASGSSSGKAESSSGKAESSGLKRKSEESEESEDKDFKSPPHKRENYGPFDFNQEEEDEIQEAIKKYRQTNIQPEPIYDDDFDEDYKSPFPTKPEEIEDEDIAKVFLEEFEKVYEEAKLNEKID